MCVYNYVFRYIRERNRMSSLEFHMLRKISRDYARIRCSRGGGVLVRPPDLGVESARARAEGNYSLNYKYRQGGLRETDYTVAT